MRLAFSALSVYSHLMPAVMPAAIAAKAAGHEVAVATGTEFTDEIERAGLHPLPLPNLIGFAQLKAQPGLAEELGLTLSGFDRLGKETMTAQPGMFAGMFAGPLAGIFAKDMIAALREWTPDLVVNSSGTYGGYYAAEHLGLPQVTLDISPLGYYDDPAVLERMNEQRAELDLAPVIDPLHPFQQGHFGIIPRSYYPQHRASDGLRCYRPTPHSSEPLDPAIAALPGDKPLVLATLGSNAGTIGADGQRSVLDSIVEAFGDLEVTGVVALGAETEPENWQGARPDNVHLVSFAQQRLLLPACDAFLSHCGFSGVRESLEAGVPMIGLPIFAEQPHNATRITELGLGVRLTVEGATRESVREATRTVLDDPGYRFRAKKFQREFLAMPDFGQLADDLAALVRN